MYLWLGLSKHKKEVLKGLPLGYEDTHELRRSCRIVGTPPGSVRYEGKHQLFNLDKLHFAVTDTVRTKFHLLVSGRSFVQLLHFALLCCFN